MKRLKQITALVLMLAVLTAPTVFAAGRKEVPLVTPPNKTSFYEGKDWALVKGNAEPYYDFDLTGTSVNYDGQIIKYYVYPWGANMWPEPVRGVWKPGVNDIYIYVDDTDYNGDVYAKSTLNLISISKIEISAKPNTTLVRGVNWHYDSLGFIVVDNIDLTGLVIKVTYADGTSEIIKYNNSTKDLIQLSVPESTDNLVLGTNRYIITYNGKSVSLDFDFQDETIKRASVETQPTLQMYNYKTNWKYVKGEIVPTIDLSGLSVTAVYNSGKKETVSYNGAPARFSVKSGQKYYGGANLCTVLLDGRYEFNISISILRYGDVNLDGEINSSDALAVLRSSVQLVSLDATQKKYADVTADSKVNSSDALTIINYSVGLISSFAAEK